MQAFTTRDVPRVRGPVHQPGEPDYDEQLRGFNTLVPQRPAWIVGVTCLEDVASSVAFARARGVKVAVQATGHGLSVPADGALRIDTRRMRGIRIDPERMRATIEAGVRSGELVAAAASHGLAPLNGSAPSVGTVSYTLSGGVALLGRKFGYAADHVHGIRVVTADGVIRDASQSEHSDLFWALRGGRGNYGVVTSMEVGLMPVREIYGGGLFFAGESIPAALHRYVDWLDTIPEEMGTSFMLTRMPSSEGVPSSLRGQLVCHIRIVMLDARHGPNLIEPLVAAGPAVNTVARMQYRDCASIYDEPSNPVPFFGKTSMLGTLEHDAVAEMLHAMAEEHGYFIEVRHFDGAMGRPARVPNAIGRRDGRFSLFSGSVVSDRTIESASSVHRALHARLQDWATGGVCLNFLGPGASADELRSGYRQQDFERLTVLKKQYDPLNMFCINHNIAPCESAEAISAQ